MLSYDEYMSSDHMGRTYRNPKAPTRENTASTKTPLAYHALLLPTSALFNCRDEASMKRLHLDLLGVELLLSVSVMMVFTFFSSLNFSCVFDEPAFSRSSGNDILVD